MTACCCSTMSPMTACSAPMPGRISARSWRELHARIGRGLWLAGRLCARHGHARQSRGPRLAAFLGRAAARRRGEPARPALARAGRAAGGAARRSAPRRSPPASLLHGDLWTGNILVRDGQLAALDRPRLLSRPCRGRSRHALPVRSAARGILGGLWRAGGGLGGAASASTSCSPRSCICACSAAAYAPMVGAAARVGASERIALDDRIDRAVRGQVAFEQGEMIDGEGRAGEAARRFRADCRPGPTSASAGRE